MVSCESAQAADRESSRLRAVRDLLEHAPVAIARDLLSAAPDDPRALRMLGRLGFADPPTALRNLHALAPTPREAELLRPTLPRLLAELAASPDPDMALNNLERLAAQGERAAFLAPARGASRRASRCSPGSAGTSQFLADTLRRHPTLLPWLLEARTMRQWLADELEADLASSLEPFTRRETRMNALRRFKYRQLLRIGCRDILGDADLTVTTEELSHLADVCLGRGLAMGGGIADGCPTARRWAPDGTPTGLAVIGMGKLGGDELNYSSDIDLIFVYGDDGDTAGGLSGPHRQRRLLRRGGAAHRGRARVGHRGGPRLPRGSAAAAGGPDGRARSSRSTAIARTSRTGPSSGSARR